MKKDEIEERVLDCMKARRVMGCQECVRYKNGGLRFASAACPYGVGVERKAPKARRKANEQIAS